MAEARKIIIEIMDSDGKTKEGNKKNDTDKALEKMLHPIKTLEKSTLGKNVLVNQAYQQIKASTSQTINLTLNRYFNMKEDYLNETTFNNVKNTFSRITNLAASTIAGAMYGGGIPGAVIGFVGGVISDTVQYQSRLSGYYSQLNATNYQTGFNRIRAGLTDGGRGTEN